MTRNEILSLIMGIAICIIISSAFIMFLKMIHKQKIKLIKAGLEDEELKTEYIKEHSKSARVIKKINLVLSVVLSIVFLGSFTLSIYSQIFDNDFPICGMAHARVVNSGSMSYKHEANTYLEQNNLNDQFDTYDIILTYELPDQFELELYDVVVYEVNEILVVHRIIGIEEPNESHPNERYFRLKGDANKYEDKYPVKYEQMRAIYKGEKIPFIGVLVMFFQSTLGYVALVVVAMYVVLIPIAEAKLDRLAEERLIKIGFIDAETKNIIEVDTSRKEER